MMINVRAEQVERAQVLAATEGIRPLATVGTTIKRAVSALAAWISKALFTPSPKLAAGDGLEVWAGIEHVSHYETYRLQQMRGVPR
ncbi:MAG TPA: hypothetical protein VGK74_23365 [Symbiobacteriaceae bacterium]